MRIIHLSGTFSNGKTTLMNDLASTLGNNGKSVITVPSVITKLNALKGFKPTAQHIAQLRDNTTIDRGHLRSMSMVDIAMWNSRFCNAILEGTRTGADYVILDRHVIDSLASGYGLIDAVLGDSNGDKFLNVMTDAIICDSATVSMGHTMKIFPLTSECDRQPGDESKADNTSDQTYIATFKRSYLHLKEHLKRYHTPVCEIEPNGILLTREARVKAILDQME